MENKDQLAENKGKLKRILQSAGGTVEENGKRKLLVSFEKAVVVLDDGYSLKIDGTNKIDVKNFGFYVAEGISEENPGNFTLMPTIVPVEC